MYQDLTNATLVLGDVRTASMYCFMMLGMFTLIAAWIFRFLAFETKLRKELRSALDRPLALLSIGKSLGLVLPAWILSCGWFYNVNLGTKYFEVTHSGEGATATLHFHYHFPDRTRDVPLREITSWSGHEYWKRGLLRDSLHAHLADGRVLEAGGIPQEQLRAQQEIMQAFGIKLGVE